MSAHRHRRVLFATIVGALTLAACTANTGGAGSPPGTQSGADLACESGASELSFGDAEIMPDPGVLFQKPAEGFLNGYEFSLHVIGYGEESCVSTDGGDYSAPAGAGIVVVEYNLNYLGNTTDLADVDFVVDRQPVSIPNGQYQGMSTVGVSVPKGAGIELQASDLGLTEQLSLTTGKLVGPVPEVLYRSQSGPDDSLAYDRTVAMSVIDRSDGFTATDELTIDSVTLTYFSPIDPTTQPNSVNGAFLVVGGSEQTAANSQPITWLTALPPNRLRLVLPDHRVIEADPASTYTTSYPQDLLDGVYFFDVPGDFTTGTIEITPGVFEAYEDSNESPSYPSFVGTAKFPLSFPPLAKVTPTPKKKPAKAKASATTTTRAAAPAKAPRHRTSLPLVALVVVLLVALAAATLVVRRRRAGPVAVDANLRRVRPQPALPAVPRLALMPGPPREQRHQSEPAESDGNRARKPIAMGPAPNPAPAMAPVGGVPDDPAGGPVLSLLGPEEISNCQQRPKRKKVRELADILASHPERSFTAEELTEMLWPSDTSKWGKPGTVQSYAAKLRKVVGAEHLPEADHRGYRFAPSVTTDWARFNELVRSSKSHPPGEARQLLRSALGLVRGMPFGGADYSWLRDERLVNHIEVAIVAAARDLVAKSLEAGDIESAWFAIDKGLLVSRDLGLFEDLLRTARATGDLAVLDDAWERVKRMMDEVPHLVVLYEELRRELSGE